MLTERTEKKGIQRPWAILIERVLTNLNRVELETTAFSTNNGVKDFLGREAHKVTRDIETLERRLITLSR